MSANYFTAQALANRSTKGRLQNLWALAQDALTKNLESAERIKQHLAARRNPNTVFGILTHEQADTLLEEAKSNSDLLIVHGITTYLSDTHYFITDGCLYDVPGFVPVTHSNLLASRTRDFSSVKEACDYYATSLDGNPLTFIPSVEALAAHLTGTALPVQAAEPALGSLLKARLEDLPKSTMTMYYCVRHFRDPERKTEYYVGGGVWAPKDLDRIRVRLYEKEALARAVIADIPDADWFSVEIEV